MSELPKEYSEWINMYRRRTGNTAGKCREAAIEMGDQFPELIRQCGHVLSGNDGKWYTHWWLVGVAGEIVDPTSNQFGKILEYVY
jgi:hypothetical protein